MVPSEPSAATPLLYKGELAQTPLAEILVKVHRYKVPGKIECRRGDELKRIFVDRGNVIFASTSLLSESLGDTLVRDGRITREQYDESVRRLRSTGKRHGVVLVEMDLLKQHELILAVRKHIQEIVWSIFAWEFGTVTFTPGREKELEFVQIELPIPDAVMRGVRLMPDARALVERLGTRTTVLTKTGEQLADLGTDEKRLLDRADGKVPLFELVTTPPLSQGENARLLYGLVTLGLLARASARQIKVQVRTDGGGKYAR
jgi:hypothetical protein